MSTNTDLAKIFYTMATILEIKGENAFKVNANNKVARALDDLVENVATIQDLSSIQGVGKSSASKIKNYLDTGKMEEFEQLRTSIPSGLLDVMNVQGIGPKTVRQLWKEADVIDIATLRTAIDEGHLNTLPRMGKKTIQNITEALAFIETQGNRTRLGVAKPLAESIIDLLGKCDGITNCTYAGSLRRGKETIGDIDILASTMKPEVLADTFCEMDGVSNIQAQGATKCSVRLESGTQVDLRIVDEEAFGAALLYFTGSKEHNIVLRERAIKQGKKLNEYSLEPSNKRKTEEEMYEDLGMPWIPPEIRDDRGEFSIAATPPLISVHDIL